MLPSILIGRCGALRSLIGVCVRPRRHLQRPGL